MIVGKTLVSDKKALVNTLMGKIVKTVCKAFKIWTEFLPNQSCTPTTEQLASPPKFNPREANTYDYKKVGDDGLRFQSASSAKEFIQNKKGVWQYILALKTAADPKIG